MDIVKMQKEAEREVADQVILEAVLQSIEDNIYEIRNYMLISFLLDCDERYDDVSISDIAEYLEDGYFEDEEYYDNEDDEEYEETEEYDDKDEEYEYEYEYGPVTDCGIVMLDAYNEFFTKYWEAARNVFISKCNVKIKKQLFVSGSVPEEILDTLFDEYYGNTVGNIRAIYREDIEHCWKEEKRFKADCKKMEKEYNSRIESIRKNLDYTLPVEDYTKNHVEELRTLRETYSKEEITGLLLAGKFTMSNSLKDEYAPFPPKPDEIIYGMRPKMPSIPDFSEYDFKGQFNTSYQKKYSELKEIEKEITRKWLEKEERKRKQKEAEEKAKEEILSRIPKRYADFFPLARKMKRQFVLHIGPTNSGKTYEAMQALKNAENGVYLGPLRLLAYEQYENMNSDGFPCSLVTGEEREIVTGARFCASTVEMCDIHRHYACAVIDEAQMVADDDRGGAWTTAILGICADEIYICMAPEAEKVIISMIEECGDTYSIIRHERKTPLEVESDQFDLRHVKKGDALIVFSRRNVHAVAAELQKKGIKSSIIYGALPYDVRHNQAELFANGTNDVVVATDAIGMGMNLPIKRVAFLEQSKFDGTGVRSLTVNETKQIAGRAGRFGIYDVGYVTSANERKSLKRKLNSTTPPVLQASISFPESLLAIDAPMLDILKRWAEIPVNAGYKREDPYRLIELCDRIKNLSDDKKFLYKCLTIAFDEKDSFLLDIWIQMCKSESKNEVFPVKERLISQERLKTNSNDMEFLEKKYRLYDLLYAYCDKFRHDEFVERILTDKKLISEMIIELLEKKKYVSKKCKCCGRILPWNHPYSMCQDCFEERYFSGWYDYY